ncbi:hypothetical protein KFL_006340075 [Klebsormidium nitens]|uniref:Nudix hydrolase domain-containing protein n=1 Tax=Klebsormidium nitens TaxID=105231 RepID=A0A1Y1IQH8_KLENI|nr:hypothetical protein KFL_006340075 [Klebsormidium nitens]|eukprot:GAQ90388.1 hypothetical protein KFL_006340075 [Klebsormidium nitens]
MSYSAGILPVSRYKGELLVLLGRDRVDGQWSDFGGRSEGEDRNDPKRTACREFFEESMGVVLDIDAIRARLQCPKCHSLIESRTMGGQVYSMYVVGVPFFHTYGTLFQKVARFARYMDAKRRFLEKSEISWFNLNDVIAAARGLGRGRHQPTPLRDVFAASVRLGAETLRGSWTLELYPVRAHDERPKGPKAAVSATPVAIPAPRGAGNEGSEGILPASWREGFRTLVRVDRDTIPLTRGQKFFPRKPAEADVQGPQACHDILGGGWSYASWQPAADKKAGGVYNCFRNVYQH